VSGSCHVTTFSAIDMQRSGSAGSSTYAWYQTATVDGLAASLTRSRQSCGGWQITPPPATQIGEVAMSRLARILLVAATTSSMAVPTAGAVPVKKLDKTLEALWT
jgi:hypothetical protein